MRKLLYAPFGVIAGVIGAKLGRKVFDGLWAKVDDEAPPSPIKADVDWRKAVGGAALEAAAYAGTKAAKCRPSSASIGRPVGPVARTQRVSTAGPARSAASSSSDSRIGSSALCSIWPDSNVSASTPSVWQSSSSLSPSSSIRRAARA